MLEASAGTGKTFTIAALAARYVADGIAARAPPARHLHPHGHRRAPRAGAGAPRERRERPGAGAGRCPRRRRTTTSCASSPRRPRRRSRGGIAVSSTALADFDAATIATTHGFCQHILSGLGVAGDVETDITFIEDPTDLVEEVVDDLYVRAFWKHDEPPPFDRAEALDDREDRGRQPRGRRSSRRTPTRRVSGRCAGAGAGGAQGGGRRKRRRKILTYDDLLTRLSDDAGRPGSRPGGLRPAARALPDRAGRRVPGHRPDPVGRSCAGPSAMAARRSCSSATRSRPSTPSAGADVYAYLDAARTAGAQATLGVNWRSDQAPDRRLRRSVRTAPSWGTRASSTAPSAPPTPTRSRACVALPASPRCGCGSSDRDDGLVALTAKQGWVNKASGRLHIADDLAADVVALLSSEAEVLDRHGRWLGDGGRARATRPRRRARAHEPPRRAGARRAGRGRCPGGHQRGRERVRDADRPRLARPARGARTTVLVDAGAGRGPDGLPRLDRRADRGGRRGGMGRRATSGSTSGPGSLRTRGVASLLETVSSTEGLPGRLLVRADGERALTDLRHIGQLLHLEAVSEQLGHHRAHRVAPAADRGGRRRHRGGGPQPPPGVRLRGGAGAHHPPGQGPRVPDRLLPVPLGPELHPRGRAFRCSTTLTPATSGTIDVGGAGSPGFDEHFEQHVVEERGEELRLAYVALTRARHQAVVWWASSYDSRESALGPAAVRPRRRGQRRGGGVVAARRGRRAAPARRARRADADLDQPRAHHRRRRLALGGLVADRRSSSTCGRSAARSTSAGGERPTPASRPRPTRPSVSSEPEDGWAPWTRTRLPVGAPAAPRSPELDPAAGSEDEQALRGVALPLAAMPGGARIGLARALGARARRLLGGRSRRRARRTPRRRSVAWFRADVGEMRPSSPACGRRSRRRSGRCSVRLASATSPPPTASTSSPSSCPWWAATDRRRSSPSVPSPRCSTRHVGSATMPWPATPTGSATRRSPVTSGAT